MTFGQSIKTCFSKYVTFSGRAQRSEFWWWVLFVWVTTMVLSIVDSVLFGTVTTADGQLLGLDQHADPVGRSFRLAMLLPTISVIVRRLHDTDRSGWWYWIALVPLVGIIILIVWWAIEGHRRPEPFRAPTR